MIGQKLEHIMLNEQATIAFGRCISNAIAEDAATLYLCGGLGAGKTTLCRGIVQGFGHIGVVKSPTYTLVESYQNEVINIHHMDCYRLNDPQELEYIGIRDYLLSGHLQLIEWPELGKGVIAKADISITLNGDGNQRKINIKAHTESGKQVIKCATT